MTRFDTLAGHLFTKSSVPSDVESGDMFFDTTRKQLRRHNGTEWLALAMTTTSTSTSTTTSTTTSTSTSTS